MITKETKMIAGRIFPGINAKTEWSEMTEPIQKMTVKDHRGKNVKITVIAQSYQRGADVFKGDFYSSNNVCFVYTGNESIVKAKYSPEPTLEELLEADKLLDVEEDEEIE